MAPCCMRGGIVAMWVILVPASKHTFSLTIIEYLIKAILIFCKIAICFPHLRHIPQTEIMLKLIMKAYKALKNCMQYLTYQWLIS